VRGSSPDSTLGRSPDSPDRHVHLTARTGSRDPRRHRFDAVVAAFVAACGAAVLSERTIEFHLEAINSDRAFAGGAERALTLADLDLGTARALLADFVHRGRKPDTVAARARALRPALAHSLSTPHSSVGTDAGAMGCQTGLWMGAS
jgi:hypothetical protein